MARYKLEDGIIADTDNAIGKWSEGTRFDGSNHISLATGTQWDHETLYKSAKGRYYIESSSQWQGSTPSARLVEPEEAAKWILANDRDLPEDLAQYENKVTE